MYTDVVRGTNKMSSAKNARRGRSRERIELVLEDIQRSLTSSIAGRVTANDDTY